MSALDAPAIFQRPIEVDKEENYGAAAGVQTRNEAGETVLDSIPDAQYFVIPEDRKLGFFSTSLLIVNRMVGTGIFSTPSTIMQATDSVGVSLLFWLLGGITTFWLFVYLELGMAIPRSGGEKVYLERIYRRPKYLATCIFAVEVVCISLSAANSINFGANIIRAARGAPETLKTNCGLKPNPAPVRASTLDLEWVNKGTSVGILTVVCLVHALTPKLGLWISNVLGTFKLMVLVVIVLTGFAALGGSLKVPKPNNFSTFHGPGTACELPPYAKSTAAANYALAFLQVDDKLWHYQAVVFPLTCLEGFLLLFWLGKRELCQFNKSFGLCSAWLNCSKVLNEVRNAPRTLKRSAPTAVLTITILYILANIAYFAASTKSEIANSGVTVAAGFFENVWGSSRFVRKGLPAVIALSALGNVFSQVFSISRAKQELGKEGILPFSKFWSCDWPSKAPTGGILLHWLVSSAYILGPNTNDAYTFLTNLSTYAGNWIKLFVAVGLLYLTYSKTETWKEERKELHAWPLTTAFWICFLGFSLLAPFFRNSTVARSIPWYVFPTVGTGALALGVVYWALWAKVWPLFGYAIEHEVKQLPDGSEVVEYKHTRHRSFWRR
ncbi:hypothetical protein MMC07_003757 [Pseudocyphellaria aurata]|nr:hypothetical protein [Pseudocyphellaria aurata]